MMLVYKEKRKTEGKMEVIDRKERRTNAAAL